MLHMNITDQGATRQRHQVIPRTLVFLTSRHPETGKTVVLLLRGAPTKRLWANLYNGLGGHVEAGEDVLAAAVREVQEEAGIASAQMHLRGIVHIDTGKEKAEEKAEEKAAEAEQRQPGIMIFVFRGTCTFAPPITTPEGTPEWIPVDQVMDLPLVDDLYELLPLALDGDPHFFGAYIPRADGTLVRHFTR